VDAGWTSAHRPASRAATRFPGRTQGPSPRAVDARWTSRPQAVTTRTDRTG
jgi:hypothetical protein